MHFPVFYKYCCKVAVNCVTRFAFLILQGFFKFKRLTTISTLGTLKVDIEISSKMNCSHIYWTQYTSQHLDLL